MCGVVDGGIMAGFYGYEAGQSGVGDIFAWYVKNQVPGRYYDEAKAAGKSIHQYLTDLAFEEPVGAHGLVALDWHNGNRSVLVDTRSPASSSARRSPPAPSRSTARCSRRRRSGPAPSSRPSTRPASRSPSSSLPGGLLKNTPLDADVLRRAPPAALDHRARSRVPRSEARSTRPSPLARTRTVADAGKAMGRVERGRVPARTREAPKAYDALFAEYTLLHDYFGRGANDVMKRLKAMRKEVLT